MYVRKTIDVWRIYVNYGQGWEHECSELSRKAMWQTVRDYRENVPGVQIRWEKGRVKKE